MKLTKVEVKPEPPPIEYNLRLTQKEWDILRYISSFDSTVPNAIVGTSTHLKLNGQYMKFSITELRDFFRNIARMNYQY